MKEYTKTIKPKSTKGLNIQNILACIMALASTPCPPIHSRSECAVAEEFRWQRHRNKITILFLNIQKSSGTRFSNPSITFLGEKLWPVAWNKKLLYKEKKIWKMPIKSVKMKISHTHESEYRGYPFRVSGIFLQPIIKNRSNMQGGHIFTTLVVLWRHKNPVQLT